MTDKITKINWEAYIISEVERGIRYNESHPAMFSVWIHNKYLTPYKPISDEELLEVFDFALAKLQENRDEVRQRLLIRELVGLNKEQK